MSPSARQLPGERLHLQHGPSDLIIWAEGQRAEAYGAATERFQTIISEIVAELAALREQVLPSTQSPCGTIAKRMHQACQPFAPMGFVTRMSAVAGAIADEVLSAMASSADLTRAYVNNGGDIALHLAPGTSFTTAILGLDGADMGRIAIASTDGIRGIASSGRQGRSLSMGIADSVTVLAPNAAQADVAATLIGNAVDLPGHPAIERCPADSVDEASDLGGLPVVVNCAPLPPEECARALEAGHSRAIELKAKGLITGAALFLQGHAVTSGSHLLIPSNGATSRTPTEAIMGEEGLI